MSGVQVFLLLLLQVCALHGREPEYHDKLIPHLSQQIYDLTNQVTITDLKNSSAEESSFTLRAQLKFNSVWSSPTEQLLQVFIESPQVTAPTKGGAGVTQKNLKKIPDRSFYIAFLDGKPAYVVAHTSRDQSLLNLERGIASLFQVALKDGPIEEVDVSGKCNAFYEQKSKTKIIKTKTDCSHWDMRMYDRAEHPLSVSQYSRERIDFDLDKNGLLLKVESIESHRIALTAKNDVGSRIESRFVLKHYKNNGKGVEQMNYPELDEALKSLLDWYRFFELDADVDGSVSEIKGKNLTELVAEHAEHLEDSSLGKAELALSFATLLPQARITKTIEFIEILRKNEKLRGQIVDLLAAVQSARSHKAINRFFKYNREDDANLLEKYLQALSVGTHPDRAILEDLWDRLGDEEEGPSPKEHLYETLLLSLSALMHQFGFDSEDAFLKNYRDYILKKLNSDCEDNDCKTLYIRALQNLRDSQTIPSLLTCALKGEPQISVAALQALQNFPNVYFSNEHRKSFTQIFFQRGGKYDSSARTIALDILLSMKPTMKQMGDLLDFLTTNDPHYEVKTYLIQRLQMLADKSSRFRALVVACLAERPWVRNYHVLAQKGLTTVLGRELSQRPAFNESLLSVQEIFQGILKRGSVELLLNANRKEASLFKLGIFTNGLYSFVDDENKDPALAEDEGDSPATAGMEISVQGVLMRPLVFFTGQSELMGHVWSGTASKPTPAYQATTITQNHEIYFLLASGATVYTRIIGAQTIDLNGRVDFSIWNRNANTEIKQNAGTGVVGLTVAGFTFAKVENEFTVSDEPNLSLQADIDFYSGVKLCMKLQRPERTLKHRNRRSVSLLTDKPYSKSIVTNFTHKSSGRSLALNQKNNDMCNMLFY